MLYILALICPPLACLGAGKFLHALINLILCLTVFGIPLALIHAWYVVKNERISPRQQAINNYINLYNGRGR